MFSTLTLLFQAAHAAKIDAVEAKIDKVLALLTAEEEEEETEEEPEEEEETEEEPEENVVAPGKGDTDA